MEKKKEFLKESSSIIEEIEEQLEKILVQKKEKVTRSLEEKIKRERDEAQKKLDEIEKELADEKKTLTTYRKILFEFEENKSSLKEQIKDKLDRAIYVQTEIETLTSQILEELKSVSELNDQLEGISKDASGRVQALKKELKDKYGIVAQVPEEVEPDVVDFDIEAELDKLNSIKKILSGGTPGQKKASSEAPPEPEAPEADLESTEEEAPDPGPVSQPEPAPPQAEPAAEGPESAPDLETKLVDPAEESLEEVKEPEPVGFPEEGIPDNKSFNPFEPAIPPRTDESEGDDDAPPPPEDVEDVEEGTTFQLAFETLEKYRKTEGTEDNGGISYFENNERIILDSESVMSTLTSGIDETKKLYSQLDKTESPKEQCFVKQEIIRRQEEIRKLMLNSIRMSEKDNVSLPNYTLDILNIDVLKDILEKVSMENWSNKDDFNSFDSYTNELKNSYYERITPPEKYLESIIEELEIG